RAGAAAPRRATLVLDYLPNAVHAGIYRAIAAGYYRRAGIDLKVIEPTSTADTLKLIAAGKADFGLADGIDVAGLIDKGGDAQAILAITQRPLGGVIARSAPGLRSAKDLAGRTVGVTGVPSDAAVLSTVVRHAGGDPAKVRTVTIGFNGVLALATRKVAAFTGYWPADGTQARAKGVPLTIFELDENGGPAYPGLVAFTTRARIRDEPAVVRAFVAATAHGYRDTLADPARSLDDLLAHDRALGRTLTQASLRAYLPLFRGDAPRFGVLRASRVRALSRWLVANGLIRRPIAASRYATDRFVPAG
ncbi:MAG TPA: ABC transporter substrate-binding protein, partial [Solirubrobacteraceae bacterium]|nr:ABC transporter substrate-binding protein [Solirubrobacteraceae bacterium]